MASCTAAFSTPTAKVGEVIRADFSWQGGVIDPVSHYVADMYIFNPDHDDVIYTTSVQSSGTETLSYIADQPGTWYAQIFIWDGNNYVDYETTIIVEDDTPTNGNGNGDNTLLYIAGGVLVIAAIGILYMKHH